MPGIVTVSDQDSVTICLGYRHYLTFIKLYSVVFLVILCFIGDYKNLFHTSTMYIVCNKIKNEKKFI